MLIVVVPIASGWNVALCDVLPALKVTELALMVPVAGVELVRLMVTGGPLCYGGSYAGGSLGTGLLIVLIVLLIRQRSRDQ